MTVNSTKKMRKWPALLAMVMLVSLLAACGGLTGGKKSDEKRVLRIGLMEGSVYDSDYIQTQYTDLFAFNNEHIEIEVVYGMDWSQRRYRGYESTGEDIEKQPDPREELKKLMTGDNPPDVVILDFNNLGYFINENLLMPLESFIQKDNFDIDGFVPAVIDGLKSVSGNNTLYALAPQFTSKALIYNKDLFAEAQVNEYPENGMTWDEIFALTERLTHGEEENRIYGFNFSTYSYMDMLDTLEIYTAPLNLQMYDVEGENMLVDTEDWRYALGNLQDLYARDILPDRDDFNRAREKAWQSGEQYRSGPFDHDAFMSGKVAMAIIDYYQLQEIISANELAATQGIEGFEPFEWDVVTVPVHPEYPNIGGPVSMNPVMAINANAANVDDAWDLISFINGEKWAEFKSRSSSQILARKDYIKPMGGADFNMEAFYLLEPVQTSGDYNVIREKEYYWMIRDLGRNYLDQAMRGDITIEEALANWQTEGDSMLKRIKEEPDRPIYEIMDEIWRERNEREMLMRAAGEAVIVN